VLEPAETVPVKRKDRRGQISTQTLQAKAERSKARFEFTREPVEVPARGDVGAYYRAGVTSGALIAADAATARACSVPFEPAAQAYKREFGAVPAWASAPTNNPAPTAQ
jgi:hypothetical protein